MLATQTGDLYERTGHRLEGLDMVGSYMFYYIKGNIFIWPFYPNVFLTTQNDTEINQWEDDDNNREHGYDIS